jgi:DNA-binding Lrp family transcriptional regulator
MFTEAYLKILKCIEANSRISQRQLAQELGVSVGKINFCVRALIRVSSESKKANPTN